MLMAALHGRPPSPSLRKKYHHNVIRHLVSISKVPPSSLNLVEASGTPCRPLLCQPFLVIHEIYTWEVRTRSFDLIITFFHHPFSDIWNMQPHLWSSLFSCATLLLMWVGMFQFTALVSAWPYRKTSGCKNATLYYCCLFYIRVCYYYNMPVWNIYKWKVSKGSWKLAVPLVSVVGEGFFGSSEKLLPSRPEPLHSFFSVAVAAEVSMLLLSFCRSLESQEKGWC